MLTTRFEAWMASVIAMGEAKGKAEGKAEGILALLRDRIDRQTLEIDAARDEVEHLCRRAT